MEFEWDDAKAASNEKKHGVSFAEAATAFAAILPDPDHSDDVTREIPVGYSERDRLLIVSFTERPPNLRVIGARVASPAERRYHEENSTVGHGRE